MTVDVPNLARGLEATELQQLVWTAADGLDERDRQLLELTLKQNIEGEELAEIMGVKTATVYVLVNRMKERVERSLGALLVARLGRDECDELQAVLHDWDGTFSVLWRKRVARHVDSCETCERTKAGVASPAALLSAMPLVALPHGLRDRVLGSAASGVSVDPGEIAFTANHGFPEIASSAARRLPLWLAGAAAAVVALVGGAFVLFGGGGGDDVVESVGVEIGEAAVLVASTTTTSSLAADATTTTASATAVASAGGSASTTSTAGEGAAGPGGSAGDDAAGTTTSAPPAVDPPVPPAPTTTLGAAVAPPVTTATPATTTIPPTTTTIAPTTTLAPSSLSINGARFELGSARTATMRVTNDGATATAWSVTTGHAAVSISPSGGVLQPGQSETLTVLVDRSGLAENAYAADVTVWGDANSAAASVSWVVSAPPEIIRASPNATTLFTRLGRAGPCTLPTTLSVTAVVTDETAVSSVQARWSNAQNGASGTVTLAAGRTADTWTGTLGPFDVSGVYSIVVIATDPFGATAQQTLPAAFEVLPC